MGKKLYIGNLSFNATEEQLASACAQYGTVESCRIIMDRDTGRSKGFGFVEMSTPAEAQEAINNLNGNDFEGRQLRVNEAKPQENRGGGGGGRGGNGGGGFRNNW